MMPDQIRMPAGTSLHRTPDGDRLFVVDPPRAAPSATVVHVHGLGDHSARNFRIAARLAADGYRVLLFDLAGHGASPHEWDRVRWVYDAYATLMPRQLIQLFADYRRQNAAAARAFAETQYARLAATHVREHVAQLLRIVSRAREYGRHLPLFLSGHSMGGLLSAAVSLRLHAAGAAPDGAVLIAPAFKPTGDPDRPSMQVAVEGLWAAQRGPAWPFRFAAKRLLDLNLPVDMTWGGKWLSDVPDEVALFESDPLVPHQLPTRYASSIESLMVDVAQRQRGLPVPGLVIVPGRDGITSRDAAIDFARREAGSKTRVQLVGYDVVAHDVLRSTAGDRAIGAIREWLARRAGEKNSSYDRSALGKAS